MSNWYSQTGRNSDVALASKITLSRNLEGIPFPHRMTDEQRRVCSKKIFAAIKNSSLAGEFDLIELDKLSPVEKVALAEQSLISANLARQDGYGAVLVSKDKNMSIMLCEEEHIIITALAPAQELEQAYKMASIVDDELIKNLKLAFNNTLGFLTSNPMKLGTGMCASVVLHLSAIDDNEMLPRLKNMASKLGFEIKRVYGDDGFYELSNAITLGIDEASAINNLNAICEQIASQELATRQGFGSFDEYMDKIYRAMGTLKMARQISAKELYSLISLVRLGVSLHAFDEEGVTDYEVIGELMHKLGTATIIVDSKQNINADEANRLRADYIRKRLG